MFLNRRCSFYLLNSPPVDVAVILTMGESGLSQPVTLNLTISLVADLSSLAIKADNPSILIPTEVTSTSKPLLPLTDCLLVDSGAPSSLTAEILSARGAFRDASKAKETMNPLDTWRSACTKIKWVMGSVSSNAEVRTISIVANLTNLTSVWQLHLYTKMALSLLSMIPKVDLLSLLLQECAHPSLIWLPDFLGTGPAR